MQTADHMEIERKWIVKGWPDENLPLIREETMRQGYVTVEPTVRIREERAAGEEPKFLMTLKSSGQLSRREIEFSVGRDIFGQIEALIGRPLIPKVRRTYRLPGGLALEVNHVDAAEKTAFWYAEVEFLSEEEAFGWDPASCGLDRYLSLEVTGKPGESMGAYWQRTRCS